MELLVVIGLIGTLAVLLHVSVSAVRERSEMVRCSANLRQLALAIHGYAADHDGRLPGPIVAAIPSTYGIDTQKTLGSMLRVYLNLPKKPGGVPDQPVPALVCRPGEKIVRRQGGDKSLPIYYVSLQAVTIDDSGITYRPFGYSSTNPSQVFEPLKVRQIHQPASALLMMDADQILVRSYQDNPRMPATPSHRTVRNLLFLDGHVEALSLEESARRVP